MKPPGKKIILFTLIYKNERYPVRTYPHEHPSLMSLISAELSIPGFGLCSGMGSCGTCLVVIRWNSQAIGRNLLSCSVPVTDDWANVEITVPKHDIKTNQNCNFTA